MSTESLGTLSTTLDRAEILDRLQKAARRGKLAGFEKGQRDDPLFHITDFGTPFESRLSASLDEHGTMRFSSKVRPLMPLIFAVVLIITIWPGVWMTESLISTYFPNTLVAKWTYWWYLIMTVPFCPLAFWSAWRRSSTTALEDGNKIISDVGKTLEG